MFESSTASTPVARWMGQSANLVFRAQGLKKISFDLTTHLPELKSNPVQIEVSLNGVKLADFSLFRQGWLTIQMDVPNGRTAASIQPNVIALAKAVLPQLK